jgi:hypothetical protein
LLALLVTVTVPESDPVLVGANLTLSVSFPPGATVTGVATELKVKAVPAMPTAETVTLEEPLLEIAMDLVRLVFTVTLPNATLVGDAASVPAVVEVPVPLKAIFREGLAALLVTVTAPERAPVEVGVNFTLNVRVFPAPSVTGVVTGVREKPVPLALIAEMLTFALPELVTTTDFVLDFCNATLPNGTELGEAASVPDAVEVPDEYVMLSTPSSQPAVYATVTVVADFVQPVDTVYIWPALMAFDSVWPVLSLSVIVPLAPAKTAMLFSTAGLVKAKDADFAVLFMK